MRRAGLLLLLLLVGLPELRAQAVRPRIGLTLSGGGARGLAHIGLLQALDSAGLPVDYVTGTSMGAVVGSLYAAGYRGTDIERMVRELDWNALLTNAAPLPTVTLAEKDEVGRYLVELPLVKGAFQLPSGVLESEELWLKLSELHFPYYRSKNFAELQRGFRCVATDVLSGEAVVLQRGEIVPAVRASMAIPSVFTPVQYQGRRLVDGGIVRNFPVSEVRAMGATLVIGSNVSSGAYTENSLRSPLDVLLQISSFKDNADFQQQRALCNVYLDYPLTGYTAGSFTEAAAIMAIGRRQGRAALPRLQHLADSLRQLYGPETLPTHPPPADSVYIGSYQVQGLRPENEPLLLELMQFRPRRYYTPRQLTAAVRGAFGTRYFSRLTYTLHPRPDGSAHLALEVVRAPRTQLRLGLHYHSLTGIGLIGVVSTKDFLLPFSTSQVALNIGENPRLRLKHFQYFTRSKRAFVRLLAQAEQLDITRYDARFRKIGLYNQRYGTVHAQVLKELNRNAAVGLGTRYEYVRFRPEIAADMQLKGRLQLLNSYLLYEENTLNTPSSPTRGRRIEAELGGVYGQHPDFQVLDGPAVVGTDASPPYSFRPYLRARLHAEAYRPLSGRATGLAQVQLGANFNYRQVVVNDFVVGGLTPVLRNQLTFAGLPEAALLTSSAAALLLGYRYALGPRLSTTLKANALYHDFLATNLRLQPAGLLYGGSLTLSYRSLLGTIDASLMYADLTGKLRPYFNVGVPFGYR